MPILPERWRRPRPPACTSSRSAGGTSDRRDDAAHAGEPYRRDCAAIAPDELVPSTRGSRASSPANSGRVPLEGALRDGDTNVRAPSGRVGFGGVFAPGASGLATGTERTPRAPGSGPDLWDRSDRPAHVPDDRSSRSWIAAPGCSAQTPTATALATDAAVRRARFGPGGRDGGRPAPRMPRQLAYFADRLVGGAAQAEGSPAGSSMPDGDRERRVPDDRRDRRAAVGRHRFRPRERAGGTRRSRARGVRAVRRPLERGRSATGGDPGSACRHADGHRELDARRSQLPAVAGLGGQGDRPARGGRVRTRAP